MLSTREPAWTGETPPGPRSLAVALGVAHASPPAVHLPPLSQRLVPGASPLEATGWAAPDEPPQAQTSYP